jgi:hypothetical protein
MVSQHLQRHAAIARSVTAKDEQPHPLVLAPSRTYTCSHSSRESITDGANQDTRRHVRINIIASNAELRANAQKSIPTYANHDRGVYAMLMSQYEDGCTASVY